MNKFLILIFISVSLQAMELEEGRFYLQKMTRIDGIKKRKYEKRFQSLPPDIKKNILSILVSQDEKKSAKGLFSLACTSKENKKLVEDFCKQSNEAQQLKIKYLEVNDKNVVNLLNFARELSNDEKMQECEHFMAKGIQPSSRDKRYDFLFGYLYCCCFSEENDFKEIIKQQYDLETGSFCDLSQDLSFKLYVEKRDDTQRVSCPMLCLFTSLLGLGIALMGGIIVKLAIS